MGEFDGAPAQTRSVSTAMLWVSAEVLASYLREVAENEWLKAEGNYLRARIAQEDERLAHGV